MHIGKRIQELRKLNGMTQQELADRIALSLSMVKKIEIGNRDPGTDALINLSDLFNVSLDYLLTGKEPAKDINLPDGLLEEIIKDMESRFNIKATDSLRRSMKEYIELSVRINK